MSKKAKKSIGLLIPALAALALLWAAVGRPGLGQQQDSRRFDSKEHDRTNFPLVGRHRTTACEDCHLKGVFEGTPRLCEQCHWQRRQDDRYKLRLGSSCGDCHTPESWKKVKPNTFRHEAATGFRLEGIHRSLDCAECHGEEGFRRDRIGCYDCHAEDFQEARDPDHIAARFPTQCQICHTNGGGWEAHFTHSAFERKGRHREAGCVQCHASGQYQGLSHECAACHLDDYNGTTDPNHRALNYPLNCESCHGTESVTWEGAQTNHDLFWPRQGAHRNLNCSACHYRGYDLPRDCYGCHADDYNNTQYPNHRNSNIPTTCENCHYPTHTSWHQANFNHDTYWPRQGAHRELNCSACHDRGYDLPRDCYGCHADDYNNTRDPNHRSASFPTTCENCHYSTHTSWHQAVFNHTFPIRSGKHAGLSCTECHKTSNYREFMCLDCHAHEKSKMDSEHAGRSGYSYNSQACFGCHPHGSAG